MRAVFSTKTCELTEKFVLKVSIRSSPFETFLIFPGAEVSAETFQGPKCTSQIRKCTVIGLRILPPDSEDICGAGTRDEPLRTSAWEATVSIAVNLCLCGTGARFSKVPIINGPNKLLPFTLKIGVTVVLHLK